MTVETMPVVEPTTTMKPSEAMRLGRLKVPEWVSGTLLARDPDGNIRMACALGAMAVGYGDDDAVGPYYWPDLPLAGSDQPADVPLLQEPCECPQNRPDSETEACSASVLVAHLSDFHSPERITYHESGIPRSEWPESRIRDWLEGLGL